MKGMTPAPAVGISTSERRNGSRICIVTSAPISCNPRVVKEADALANAGYKVRVVASQHTNWVAGWDSALMAKRTWKLNAVRWDHQGFKAKYIRTATGIQQRAFNAVARSLTFRIGVAERAYCRLYKQLLKLACQEPADLYIAHNPQALPVACLAAERLGAAVAFDSEDYHYGEFPTAEQMSLAARLLTYLEAKYLPRCRYVTAPSNAISKALVERYCIRPPLAIHNVFPWSERLDLDGQIKDRRGPALSLYWYSQVIGLNRGIQDCIRAVSLLAAPVQIHLRGNISEPVRRELLQLAEAYSVRDRFFLHPPVPPSELLSRAAEHDVGLALEQPVCVNRLLTVTNKLFFYMLAGVAIAATDTVGQRAVMHTCPGAGFLYPPGDYQALAGELQKLIDSPDLLREQKAAALRAAQHRWNWEVERRILIEAVASILNHPKQKEVVTFGSF